MKKELTDMQGRNARRTTGGGPVWAPHRIVMRMAAAVACLAIACAPTVATAAGGDPAAAPNPTASGSTSAATGGMVVPPGAATPSAPAGGPASTTTSDYIIGPGDTIQIFVWRNPELSVTVPVRPDGKISTPLVEDVVAVGKKPSELAREMESILSAYVRSPQVNIIVTGAQSTFSQVTVVGQVGRPQNIAYREGMTVLDVIIAVGGVTDYGAPNRARLVRRGVDGKELQIKVHLKDLMQKGKMSENIKVRPGDVLIVPEAMF
jgi:polysaccharide export outer membrane protein